MSFVIAKVLNSIVSKKNINLNLCFVKTRLKMAFLLRRFKQKKHRNKSKSITEICYDVPDPLCDRIHIEG